MRSLTSTAQAEILKKLGTEPITVVEIFWENNTSTVYADKDLPWANGKIKSITDVDEVIRLDAQAVSASVEVELVDTDGSFKQLFDTIDLHKRPCKVYQGYAGFEKEDAFLLLDGEVLTPIKWNEADRTIKFEVHNRLISNEVGFSPESGQLPETVKPSAIGKAWPLCFGKPVHVPVTQIDEVITGSNASYYLIPDPTLKIKKLVIEQRQRQISNAWDLIQREIFNESVFGLKPQGIILDYTSVIVHEDQLKQDREDLARHIRDLQEQIEELKDLKAESEVAEVQASIQAEIDQKQAELNTAKDDMEVTLQELADALNTKEFIEIDADNAEFEFNVIGQMREYLSRLLTEYNKLTREWNLIDITMKEIEKATVDSFTLINHDKFDQGLLEILFNGVRMQGTLDGAKYTVNKVLPRFSNIKIIDYPDRDSFIIEDSSVDLAGLYCYMADGRIFRVREQVGTRCFVDPIPLKRMNIQRNGPPDYFTTSGTDLSSLTWMLLSGASEHTEGERQQMLESAIMNSDNSPAIQELKGKINELIGLANEAQTSEVYDTINKAVRGNASYYDSLIQSANIPEGVLEEAEALISDQEFSTLLRMENLDEAEFFRALFPIQGEIIEEDLFYFTAESLKPEKSFNPKTVIAEASSIILPHWMDKYVHFAANPNLDFNNQNFGYYNPVFYLPSVNYWIAQPGSTVQNNFDFQEKYICNILPSEIKAVYAYRSIDGLRQLFPVPKSYYTKNESEDFGLIALNNETLIPLKATSISLKRPLSEYTDEHWQPGTLFVTLKSSVGPNVCDIIEYLLTTYSNVSVDSESFNYVKTKVEPFPANFALLNKLDVLTLVRDIAWQSRCRVDVVNGIAKIIYLPEVPQSVREFTEKDIEFGSLEIETTETEEIVTKLIALWKPHYEQEDFTQEIVRFNIKKYGVETEEHEFSIYNSQDLVQYAATFWSMRKANVWKKINFKTFLTNLDLQTTDAITLNLNTPYFSAGPITTIVDKITYNANDQSISIRVELPIRLGEMTQFEHFWPADIETIYPIIEDVAAGYAGDPFYIFIRTPSNFTINPENIEQFRATGRPRDYGSANLSDAADLRIDSVYDSVLSLEDPPIFTGVDSPGNEISPEVEAWSRGERYETHKNSNSKTRKNIRDHILPELNFSGTVVDQLQEDGGGSIKSKIEANSNEGAYLEKFQQRLNDKRNYLVEREDGTRVVARQLRINKDSKIPKGTKVQVTYNKKTGDYDMQVPVWLETDSDA